MHRIFGLTLILPDFAVVGEKEKFRKSLIFRTFIHFAFAMSGPTRA